jgi:D-alanyl-D-alanine-carboxypeptidase/D-alanyl-D-alanine-endopeptidase
MGRFPLARSGVLVAVAAALFLASGGHHAAAAPAATGSMKTTIASDVGAFITKTGTPGVVVAVYDTHQFGTSGYVVPFGVTSYQGKTKVTGDTVFQIGSITKVFSGTLYGVAMGKGYSKPATTAYKAIGSPASLAHATDFQKVTLVQLATHTAGFPDEVDARAADPLFAGSSTIPNTMITFYKSFKSKPKPCYLYSSAGFITLGYALADSWPGSLHGKYPSILNAEISQPLGLRCTNTVVPAACVSSESTGVDITKKPYKPATHSATDIKSTGNDMLKWMEANLGVLTSTPQYLASAIATAQKSEGTFSNCSNGKSVDVGLAWQEVPLTGVPGSPTALTKNGASGYGGESSMMVIVPSKKIGIVILTNGLGAGGPDALAKSLAEKMLIADAGGAAPAAAASTKPHPKRRKK